MKIQIQIQIHVGNCVGTQEGPAYDFPYAEVVELFL